MKIFFETKIRYDKIQENGKLKKISEAYLVEAVSFADAEANLINKIQPEISVDYTISTIRKTKISEVFINESDERYYLIKCAFISLNEKSGKEKRSISQILIGAISPDEAMSKFEEKMRDTISDYEVLSIFDTPYLDVITVQA